MLSRTQAERGRTVKQEQEVISRNHVQTFIYLSVIVYHDGYSCIWLLVRCCCSFLSQNWLVKKPQRTALLLANTAANGLSVPKYAASGDVTDYFLLIKSPFYCRESVNRQVAIFPYDYFITFHLFHAELYLHEVRVACGIFFCIFFTRTCVDICVKGAPSNT